MAAANVDPLIAKTRATRGALESTLVWFSGQGERLAAVKAEALSRGATEEELMPLTEEMALTEDKAREVADAIAANP